MRISRILLLAPQRLLTFPTRSHLREHEHQLKHQHASSSLSLAVLSTPWHRGYTNQQDRLLFDSGAAVHVCPLDYATGYPLCTNDNKPSLRTVAGEAIIAHGTRTVHYQMDARSTTAVTYVVADVSMPALSVSRLLRLGIRHGTHKRELVPAARRYFLQVARVDRWLPLLPLPTTAATARQTHSVRFSHS